MDSVGSTLDHRGCAANLAIFGVYSHSRSKNGVASLAYSRSKKVVASLAYVGTGFHPDQVEGRFAGICAGAQETRQEIMRLASRIAVFLLLLPAAEILAFLLVAWMIGFFPALGLMLLTSLAGGLVLRRVNGGPVTQFRRLWRDRAVAPTATQAGGLLVALGGILLVLPGFITDLMGAGLLVAPLRRRFGAALGRAIRRTPRAGEPTVIDLEPGEWRAIAERKPRSRRR